MRRISIGRKDDLKRRVRNDGCGGCVAHIGLGRYHICWI